MSNEILLINTLIILYLVYSAITGYKKGAIRILIPVLALIISFTLHKPVSDAIYEAFQPQIDQYFSEYIDFTNYLEVTNETSALAFIPSSELSKMTEIGETGLNSTISYLKGLAVKEILRIIVFIAMAALMKLIIMTVLSGTRLLNAMPVFGTGDKLLGGVLSILEKLVVFKLGLLAISVLAVLFPPIASFKGNLLTVPILQYINNINFS